MAGVAIGLVLDLDELDYQRRMVKNNPNPSSREPFRYYHCREDWDGLHCKKVAGPSVMPTEDTTKLITIKSYIPEGFDKVYLKYRWIPEKVFITK